VFNLIAELGGITKVVMLLFGFFLGPLSHHSFILTAARKMYSAKVDDDQLLSNDHEGDKHWKKYLIPNENISEKEFKEHKKHR
jgi:hypothetical protein